MAVSLRIVTEKMLAVNSSWLSTKIGCGMMLAGMPRYPANEVLHEVMRGYGHSDIHADKQAAKYLDSNESLLRTFCANAEEGKMPLKANYRAVFGKKDTLLVLDLNGRSCYFVLAPENKLALNNYYRDVAPGMMQSFGIVLSGSTNRLTPVGWQNLHDLMTIGDFRNDFSDARKIEVMSSLPTCRWRAPEIELGVNMLNFSDARSIRESLLKEVRKIP